MCMWILKELLQCSFTLRHMNCKSQCWSFTRNLTQTVQKYTIDALILFSEAPKSHIKAENFDTSDVDVMLSRADDNFDCVRNSTKCYISVYV